MSDATIPPNGADASSGDEEVDDNHQQAVNDSRNKTKSTVSADNKEEGGEVDQDEERGRGRKKKRKRSSAASSGTTSSGPAVSLQEKWEEMLGRLARFKERNGHCNVPNRYKEDPSLGSWVATQRRTYKILTSGGSASSGMNVERAKKLMDLGFEWSTTDPRHVPWEERYEELKAFVAANGHAEVPMRWEENVQLSNWVSKQRQDYKLLQLGKTSRLTETRRRLLNQLGFQWEIPRKGRRLKTARPPLASPPRASSTTNAFATASPSAGVTSVQPPLHAPPHRPHASAAPPAQMNAHPSSRFAAGQPNRPYPPQAGQPQQQQQQQPIHVPPPQGPALVGAFRAGLGGNNAPSAPLPRNRTDGIGSFVTAHQHQGQAPNLPQQFQQQSHAVNNHLINPLIEQLLTNPQLQQQVHLAAQNPGAAQQDAINQVLQGFLSMQQGQNRLQVQGLAQALGQQGPHNHHLHLQQLLQQQQQQQPQLPSATLQSLAALLSGQNHQQPLVLPGTGQNQPTVVLVPVPVGGAGGQQQQQLPSQQAQHVQPGPGGINLAALVAQNPALLASLGLGSIHNVAAAESRRQQHIPQGQRGQDPPEESQASTSNEEQQSPSSSDDLQEEVPQEQQNNNNEGGEGPSTNQQSIPSAVAVRVLPPDPPQERRLERVTPSERRRTTISESGQSNGNNNDISDISVIDEEPSGGCTAV